MDRRHDFLDRLDGRVVDAGGDTEYDIVAALIDSTPQTPSKQVSTLGNQHHISLPERAVAGVTRPIPPNETTQRNDAETSPATVPTAPAPVASPDNIELTATSVIILPSPNNILPTSSNPSLADPHSQSSENTSQPQPISQSPSDTPLIASTSQNVSRTAPNHVNTAQRPDVDKLGNTAKNLPTAPQMLARANIPIPGNSGASNAKAVPVPQDAIARTTQPELAASVPSPQASVISPSEALPSTDVTTNIAPFTDLSITNAVPADINPTPALGAVQTIGTQVAPPVQLPVPIQTNPILAKPADIPNLVADSIPSADPGNDRVVVQLDPPELGRVTIDFKFDGQILQGVTITGETPEALRQLRHMHFELIQALEQNGLSNSDLDFRQEQPPEHELNDSSGEPQEKDEISETSLSNDWPAPKPALASQLTSARSGLDIKV